MKNVVDPRVTRTHKLFMDAVAELIISGGQETITVREIVRKAGVNRSTFYLHFRDKQELLSQFQDRVLLELKESIKQPTYSYETALTEFEKFNEPIKALVAMFDQIQKQALLYQKLLNETEFRERFTRGIMDEVFLFRDSVWEATYMANGAVGMIRYWLENGMKENVTEMSLWLTKTILIPLGNFDK